MEVTAICMTDDPLGGFKYMNLFAKIEEPQHEQSMLVAFNTFENVEIISLSELGKFMVLANISYNSLIILTSAENNKFCITTADYDIDTLNTEFNDLMIATLNY